MTRFLMTIVLPLLLPTAIYLAWTLGWEGRQATAPRPRPVPWFWLAAAGVVLAALVLVSVVEGGGTRSGVYVPPHLEHGTIVPGHVVPALPQPPPPTRPP